MRIVLASLFASVLVACGPPDASDDIDLQGVGVVSVALDAGVIDAGAYRDSNQVQAVAKWCSDGDGGLAPHLGPCPPAT